MPDTNHLGRLEKVPLRKIWTNEEREFTPWLVQEENLQLLGDTIGLDLELQAQEKEVGPFRADILCKDTANDTWVLIESQLEKTDHVHLGQLLTYAAGLKAVTIVWISNRFTDEHRAAMDWLNEITDVTFNFFGLEVELWKIGQSPLAPKFNVVCQPNDWSKIVAAASKETQLTDAKLLQRDFWTEFRRYVSETDSPIKPTKALPQNWMNIAIGKGGIHLSAVASFYDSTTGTSETNELRAEIVLDDSNSKVYFDQLLRRKDEIESEIGESFTWHNPENAKMCRIYLRYPTTLEKRDDWSNQHKWLLEKLEKLQKVFQPLVMNLIGE